MSQILETNCPPYRNRLLGKIKVCFANRHVLLTTFSRRTIMTTSLKIVGVHQEGWGSTARTDTWWLGPFLTLCGLSAFLVYVNYAALVGEHYYADPYLSPFYSPVLFTNLGVPGASPLIHSWFGAWPDWWPHFLPASPALLILLFPASFRFTCYYYRKAYYRSFAGSPPACAVGPMAPRSKTYKGEAGLLIFQNLHRYALYFAILYIPILYYDAYLGFFKHGEFGVGVGSIVLLVNATLLAGYTLGCHSFRHLIGGHDDCMSCGKRTVKFKAWKLASWFNGRHMWWAWISLFWVGFTDAYVRMVSHGIIQDFNTWG